MDLNYVFFWSFSISCRQAIDKPRLSRVEKGPSIPGTLHYGRAMLFHQLSS